MSKVSFKTDPRIPALLLTIATWELGLQDRCQDRQTTRQTAKQTDDKTDIKTDPTGDK